MGRLLTKQRRSGSGDPRREALEILDTAYNVLKTKLDAYRELYEMVREKPAALQYIETVYGSGALRTLKTVAYISTRLTNLWRNLRKHVAYYEADRVKRFSLQCAARLLSYVRRRRKLLEKALEMKRELSELPLDGGPLIVIIGPPNAGKSTLARAIADIKTEVGDYPFTTREPVPGTTDKILPFARVTVVDSPGLLAREKLNPIERRAMAMARMPGSLLIYLLDPDPNSPVERESQLKLLRELALLNPNVVVAVNKIDAWRDHALELGAAAKEKGFEPIYISALRGENIGELIDRLRTLLEKKLSRGAAS